jgi:hypothetical protein
VDEAGTWNSHRKTSGSFIQTSLLYLRIWGLVKINDVCCGLSCELNMVQEMSQGGRQDRKSKGRTLSEQPIR